MTTANLSEAYRAAEYHVLSTHPFVMKVGEYSSGFARLQTVTGAECAIFITASNPFSVPQSEKSNDAANKELRKSLGGGTYQGVGRSAAGDWPEEKSFLAFGYEYPDTGYELARQFGQNAFLWIDERCTPLLLICNKDLMTDHDINAEYNLTLGAQWRSRHIPRPAPAGSGLDFESFLKKFSEGRV